MYLVWQIHTVFITKRKFLSEAGQLETVGNGFQDLNNKLLEKALIDYLENILQQQVPFSPPFFLHCIFTRDERERARERALYCDVVQEEPVTSLFRERERSSSRKRGYGPERLNFDNKELAKLFLEELQDGSSYNLGDLDDEAYMDARQMLYDRYRGDRGNRIYELVIDMNS